MLVVFPALNEIEISAAGFTAMMWWKLLKHYNKVCVPSMNHPKRRILEGMKEMCWDVSVCFLVIAWSHRRTIPNIEHFIT